MPLSVVSTANFGLMPNACQHIGFTPAKFDRSPSPRRRHRSQAKIPGKCDSQILLCSGSGAMATGCPILSRLPLSRGACSGRPGHLTTAGLRLSNWLRVTLVTIDISQNPPRGSRWLSRAETWGQTGLVGLSQRQGLQTTQWVPTRHSITPWLSPWLGGEEEVRCEHS